MASMSESMQRGQAERLMPLIQDMLAQQNVEWQDLGLIGVGTGPGNFTGVRLSVSAARGLALSLGIPAIGVTSLEAAAYDLPQNTLIALDARRDQLYLQLFAKDAPDPVLANLDALPEWVQGAEAITGDAAGKISDLLPNAHRIEQPTPIAEAIAHIALSRSDTAHPRPAPLYLRPADAKPPQKAAPELIP